MAKIYQKENSALKIAVSEKGAELQSLIDKSTGQEYMWSGDPAVWGKHSPVLFPVVGTLKDNTYEYEGRRYHLNRHGFAREMNFVPVGQLADEIVFLLKQTEETLGVYPFEFDLKLKYRLDGKTLTVTYDVCNTGAQKMWFSIGGHPAFKLPLFRGDAYAEYALEFEEKEHAGKWPIEAGGLLAREPVPFLNNTNILRLNKGLFAKDAVVLKDLRSRRLALRSDRTGTGFDFSWTGFPYLGIWAAPGADFVCIEPWCGIADTVGSGQDLTEKEGICGLEPGRHFIRSWSVTIIS
ncbi:aldose 1-epimerase family protein [Niabella drilacis]|uniref:Galactose mutarotase n=1 Tax=Niabella drilacis (strain DSM 25811 / CCM 8410 / CCUG 62505 / LMG 26954 / E90) TaxID=1285928 RepID=A0A1G6ZSH2_NIADE|nr:aldose 1-epimerase family protein [Niabella drilacis]SDE04765.1 Galactose mutarotase [Niabella drilacis]